MAVANIFTESPFNPLSKSEFDVVLSSDSNKELYTDFICMLLTMVSTPKRIGINENNLEGLGRAVADKVILYRKISTRIAQKMSDNHQVALDILQRAEDEVQSAFQRDLAVEYNRLRSASDTSELYELLTRAETEANAKRLDEAESLYQKSLEMATMLRHQEPVGSIYCRIGFLYEARGDLPRAIEMHRAALKADSDLGKLQGLANHYMNLGRGYQDLGETEIGGYFLNHAIDLFQRLGDKTTALNLRKRLRVPPRRG